MNTSELVRIIQTALTDEIKVIERIEADDNSIFLKVDGKIYLISIQERKPVNFNVTMHSFNPQPKPGGKKK